MTDATAAATAPELEPWHPLSLAAAAALPERVRALGWQADAAQEAALARLTEPAVHGVYLWGPVGRGKTALAEEYLAALAPAPVRRFHVHGFFRALQRELFGGGAGLTAAIAAVVGDAQAVLFDEFHVHDVADAVYLTAVLRWLREHRVLLIATSNYAPEDLFPDSQHHHRFLPAIAQIEADLVVVPLGDGRDHRIGRGGGPGFGAGSWRVGEGAASAPGTPVALDPDGVPLEALAVSGEGAVFSFAQLCERPLGAQQYLWLADRFRRIAVTAMPDPALIRREPLARFSILVDVLHDRGIPLDVQAAGSPERMRDAPFPPRDLARTLSRLALLRPPVR